MIWTALNRTWAQMLDPTFRKVIFSSLIASLATLILLTAGLSYIWPESFRFGIEWMDEFFFWLDEAALWSVAVIGWYILFPAFSALIMSLFAEQIALAVEKEWYPARQGMREIKLGEAVLSALVFALTVITLNVLAIVPYLILLLVFGIGAILYLALNGYLMGREYFELVALRHMPRREVNALRQRLKGRIFTLGFLLAFLFLVPVVNLFAPVIATAAMTHIVHLSLQKEPGWIGKRDHVGGQDA